MCRAVGRAGWRAGGASSEPTSEFVLGGKSGKDCGGKAQIGVRRGLNADWAACGGVRAVVEGGVGRVLN